MGRTLRWRVGSCALAAALCGCGSGSVVPARRVVTTPPPGFTGGPKGAGGRWSLAQVVTTSPVPQAVSTAQLRDTGAAGGGYGSVFAAPSGFAVVVVVRAHDPASATELAKLQAASTSGLAGGSLWDPTVVPNAFGYLFDGVIGATHEHCQGAWLARGRFAAHLYTCSPSPGDVSVVKDLLIAEYPLLA